MYKMFVKPTLKFTFNLPLKFINGPKCDFARTVVKNLSIGAFL